MTVAELTGLLAAYPPDLRVVVDGYEDGYDDLSPEMLQVVRVGLNTGKRRWEGQHDDARNLSAEKLASAEVAEALALRRTSN